VLNHQPEIIVEPYKKIVVHELIEYHFDDMIDTILLGTRAAGGTTVPILQWCNGVVFQIQPFNPNSDTVIEEQMHGVIHYAAVTFAMKEKFEAEVRKPLGIVRLVDTSVNPNFVVLTETLKAYSKLKN
jgi:hypothetical protein